MAHLAVLTVLVLLLVVLLSSSPALAQPAASDATDPGWTQWRGPDRDGSAPGAPWPDSLAGLEMSWELKSLGPSYSGPIVAADRVFITETVGGETEVVRALSRATGEELWRASWPGKGSVPFFAAANGDWIRSTPAYDGQTLFIGGMNELFSAFDGATGELLWRIDFPQRFGTGVPSFGFSSSPLVDGQHVYLQAANSVVKLAKATGEVVWRSAVADGEMTSDGAFSSPVLTTLDGQRQLLVQSRSHLQGLDLESGEVLWQEEVPNFRGMNILTPTVYRTANQPDAVFTSSHRNGSRLYRVRSAEDGWSNEEEWTFKASGNMSSPVILDGHAYLHLGNGRFTCIDLATGESRWTTTPFGKYWSVAVRGDRLLALDERGELLLIHPTPEEFRLLDRRQVSEEETWAHLAVSGDEVFVRSLHGMVAYRWSDGLSKGSAAEPRRGGGI